MFDDIWKPAFGFPDYEVSSSGKVRRATKGCGTWVGRILKPSVTHGYLHVSLSSGCNVTNKRLHVLVCETFHGPRPDTTYDAAHEDGNKENNSESNLSWKTKVENQQDRIIHGTDIRGENVFGSKLTTDAVREIRERFAAGESRKKLAAEYGIDKSNIWLIGTKRTWRHVK